jgi:hypothetical protein
MDKKTIEAIRNKHQAIADRNFENYQMSGEPRYLRTNERESDLVDICNLALNAADTATSYGHLKADFADYANQAGAILYSYDQDQAKQLLRNIYRHAVAIGLIADKWKGWETT